MNHWCRVLGSSCSTRIVLAQNTRTTWFVLTPALVVWPVCPLHESHRTHQVAPNSDLALLPEALCMESSGPPWLILTFPPDVISGYPHCRESWDYPAHATSASALLPGKPLYRELQDTQLSPTSASAVLPRDHPRPHLLKLRQYHQGSMSSECSGTNSPCDPQLQLASQSHQGHTVNTGDDNTQHHSFKVRRNNSST